METKKITGTNRWGSIYEYEVNHLGQKHGLYKYWYPNGKLSVECTYKNGKIECFYKSWLSEGVLELIDTNKKDERFGTMIEFYY
jgi:antitoxin component YwqK of YwqJK toxin-antitoxin module